MSNGKLEEFKAYQKALELFDMVVQDISQWLQDRRLDRLVTQRRFNLLEHRGRLWTGEHGRISSFSDHSQRLFARDAG